MGNNTASTLKRHPTYLKERLLIPEDRFPPLDLGRLLAFSLATGGIWLVVLLWQGPGQWLLVAFTGLLLLRSFYLLLRGDITGSLAILFYLAMIQPALREYAGPLPHFALDYFFLAWSFVFFLKHKIDLRLPAILYLLYFILDIIGAATAFDSEIARSIVVSSSILCGSLILSSNIRFERASLLRIFNALLLGVMNLLVIIGYTYATNGEIVWMSESNSAASGNMGPVQISMLLAVGAILLIFLAERVGSKAQLIYPILAAGISGVMLLTFSRNGLYLTILALAVYFLVFSPFRLRTILFLILLSILGLYILNASTQIAGPAFTDRFTDLNPSNRDLLVGYGWRIFLDNFWLGTGTGNYYDVISQARYFGAVSGAHNELIRAAAEHGIFGLLLWVGFALSAAWTAFSQHKGKARALRMALMAVFLAYLAVNGLKLIIQPFLLMLSLSIDEF